MAFSDQKTLVSTDWLARHIENPDLRIIDASWYLPAMQRDGRGEYEVAHIPGAVFYDIDKLSDQQSDLPHMAPDPETFAVDIGAMGFNSANQVVVYDGAGLFSAARVWWLFRLMGHFNVAVLDGGLAKWRSEGRDLVSTTSELKSGRPDFEFHAPMVKNAAQVADASARGDYTIVDARAGGRFRGEDPEPRAGMRSGHIPNSRNVFFKDLLNDNGTMKTPAELRSIFVAAGVDLDKPLITTCGSGVTAAVLSLALERIGHDNHALYDGSWSEWGLESDRPVATGDA